MTTFEGVYNKVKAGAYNHNTFRQEFIEALKTELKKNIREKSLMNLLTIVLDHYLKVLSNGGTKKGFADVRLFNFVVEVETPPKNEKEVSEDKVEQLYDYMKSVLNEYPGGTDIIGFVTNGWHAKILKLNTAMKGSETVLEGGFCDVARSFVRFIVAQQIFPLSPSDITVLFSFERNIDVIALLFKVIKKYRREKGLKKYRVIENYRKVWEEIFVTPVSIPSTLEKSTEKILKEKVYGDKPRKEDKLDFLFVLNTYMNLVVRIIALNVIGRACEDWRDLQKKIEEHRNLFEENVFEWVFEALSDNSLESKLRSDLEKRINELIEITKYMNIREARFDVFRKLYQSIIPGEFRKALGEFYTPEDIVEKTLTAAGLDKDTIKELYEKWLSWKKGEGKEDFIILDPACGSGTFLIKAVEKILNVLKDKKDVVEFIEDAVVGIDINPLAVDMTRINIVATIQKHIYPSSPKRLRIYWADSLSLYVKEIKLGNGKVNTIMNMTIPSIGRTLTLPNPEELADIVALLNEMYESIERGESFEDFKEKILTLFERRAGKLSENMLEQYQDVIDKLWNTLVEIHKQGNRKIFNLIKEAVVVFSLKGRCAFVVGNPPWVRIRNISANLREELKKSFKYFKENSSYDPRFKMTEIPQSFKDQHDLSMAFVEKGVDFLREGGVLAYVITSKIAKALYAGALREDLMENTTIERIIDYSLHPVNLFEDATNYPLIIAVRKKKPEKNHKVKITVYNARGDNKTFELPQEELPLDKSDRKSPWIFAPESVVKTLRKVQGKSMRFGDRYKIMMGVKTGNDGIFLSESIRRYGENMFIVDTKKKGNVFIESDVVHVALRGRDIVKGGFEPQHFIIFPHDKHTFKPLWDQDQKHVLEKSGILSGSKDVRATGSDIVYVLEGQHLKEILNGLNNLKTGGYKVDINEETDRVECTVSKGNDRILSLRIVELKRNCKKKETRVYVSGLRIPGRLYASRYFRELFEELVRRSDYKKTDPPWVVFRVSKEKLSGTKVAWREMSRDIEACIVEERKKVDVDGKEFDMLIVPLTTVYFVTTKDNKKEAQSLCNYLNMEFTNALVKLWSWLSKGGTFRHNAAIMGHLPIPEKPEDPKQKDEKDFVKEAFGLKEEDYDVLVEYGKWLSTGVEEKENQEEETKEEE